MQIFKTKDFGKRADSSGLADEDLAAAINEVRDGLVDAALGGGLFKKRIAIGGKGKSGGVRSNCIQRPRGQGILSFRFSKKQESEHNGRRVEATQT
jgi:hypothetical protein